MSDPLLELPDSVPEPLRDLVEAAATERGTRVLWWVIGVFAGLTFLGFLAVGANRPADPELVGSVVTTTTLPPRVPIPGFAEAGILVSPPGGVPTPFCVLVADTPEKRAQGLMGQGDLHGYDGMVFTYAADTTARFHMRNTPLPLSIAFFDGSGTFVSSADMTPCNQARCQTYRAARRYRFALETTQGNLGRLGVAPGSRLSVGGPCPLRQ